MNFAVFWASRCRKLNVRGALAIVRTHSGIQSAIDSAKSYVHIAETECDRMPQGVATAALRAAPAALLASIIR